MMGISGYQTKKELKIAATLGAPFHPIETSFFGPEYKGDGTYCVVGPSPSVRKWFANVTVKNGRIIKVT